MSRLADEGGPPIDDLNACRQRPPITPGGNVADKCEKCADKHVCEQVYALCGGPFLFPTADVNRQRPPIDDQWFPFGISRANEWKTPLTWTDGLANDTGNMGGFDNYEASVDDLNACYQRPPIRTFSTGATRDTEEGKNDYIGFLSPLVIEAFGDYMTRHRVQADGSLRDSDNWKLGQPKSVYVKSAFRHFLDLWKEHCGYASRDGIDEALGGLLFNIMGYWLEYLRERGIE